ncbi:diaminopimelate decarboxylase [Streptomyces sp. NBC_01511]|uniref:diaminopimelate decarboxylase n=1 Tax=Streptomyces sp. NBC_01511 TaxID=2903889 RepID=UPI0038707781
MRTEPPLAVNELSTPSVWPASAVSAAGGDLSVAGVSLLELAGRYGTPAYVLDEGEVRSRARAWLRALPEAEIVYAAKAFLCRAVVDWMEEEGLGLDVCSAGELELAATRGFPVERIVLHGNAKSPQDLGTALRLGVGRIVIDADCEIARLAARVPPHDAQQVLVRVLPGIEAGAHPKIRTGAEGQKFGLSIASGDAEDAVARILGQPQLELAGLHCHLGSQIATPEPYERAVREMVAFFVRIRDRFGVVLPELDLGGGFAAAYLPGDAAPAPAVYGRRIRRALTGACAEAGLPVPRLTVEPGRSIMAPAGIALYRVLAVKRSGGRVFVAVDGGMSDNPRPALYGARYTVRRIGRASAAPMRAATVVGRHCEAGDVLAVPASGAYQVSMASGYNMTGRPPVVAVAGGRSRLLVRRETFEDLRRRDVGL